MTLQGHPRSMIVAFDFLFLSDLDSNLGPILPRYMWY